MTPPGLLARIRGAARRQLRDPVYANGYALILSSASAAALGFVFWLVAARRFSPEDLGWGAAVVSAATLAALIGKAGFDAGIVRYAPGARERVLRKLVLFSTIAAVALTAATSFAILALAGGGIPSLAPLRAPEAAAGFMLLATGTAIAWMLDAFFVAEQAAVLTLARNVAFNLVKILVPLFLVASLSHVAVPIAWGAGLAVSLVVAFALVPIALRIRRQRPVRAGTPRRRDVVGYAGKNYVLNVAEFLPGLVLPLLVLETMGAAVNARFFLAWTIATVGFLASKAVGQSSFAALVREDDARPALRKGALLSAATIGPFALLLVMGAEPILSLFGEGYPEAAGLLRLLALSLAPLALTNLFLAYLKARDAGWALTLVPAASLVATLALAPFALATGGIAGLGWLWLAVQTATGTYSLARLATIRRKHHDGIGTDSLHRRAHEG